MNVIQIGSLHVLMKYQWHPKGKKIHYRRRIPSNLRQHYPSAQLHVTKSTGTHDPHKALSLLVRINKDVERQWERLRQGTIQQTSQRRLNC